MLRVAKLFRRSVVSREFLSYGLVSVAALALDTGLLRALVRQCRWNYLLASVLSFLAGAVFAYFLSIRFVFRFRAVENRTLEFFIFIAFGIMGSVINALSMAVAISGLGLSLMPAKALAAICTFTSSFFLRQRILFASKRV